MTVNTKSMKRKTGGNIGGLASEHYWAFADEIKTYPDGLNPDLDAATSFEALLTLEATDLFEMQAGKYFGTIPCILEEGQLKSTMVGPLDSRAFENTGTLANQGNDDELKGHAVVAAGRPIILLMRENNGSLKVLGTKEYPAQLDTFEWTNGGKVADGNLQKYAFKSNGKIPSPTYTGAIPLAPVVPTV
jgi:hypothetical protein